MHESLVNTSGNSQGTPPFVERNLKMDTIEILF